jgi:hypothetical protein
MVLWVVAAGFGVSTVCGQWVTQTWNLRPGWNAVFLELQPEPSECDGLFAGLPIESVWAWNHRFSPVQYISDPNTLLPGQPDWLTYLPATSPHRAVANLFALQGGRPYLIKTTASVTLTLQGHPVRRVMDWAADSYTLAGFHVTGLQPPVFQNFFSPSPAQAGQPIYRLTAAGLWERVTSPSTTPIHRGESYWIRSAGASTYSGPFQVRFEQGRGLDYGQATVEQTLRIQNTSLNATTFTLSQLPSGSPSSSDYPALAGEVPLSFYRSDPVNRQFGWVPITGPLTSPAIQPGNEWMVRLAVRRVDMASLASLPPGYSEARYQSLIEVRDGAGSQQLIPVTAEGPATIALSRSSVGAGGRFSRLGVGRMDAHTPLDPRSGLWVGSVAITNVSQAAVSSVPVPTASEFQFRLILHVDGAGETRLLQKVVLAWTNGLYALNEQGLREVLTPGRFALVTDDALLHRFVGSALRDGVPTGQRISSAAFSFRDPILIQRTAGFGALNGDFTCLVPLGYDDSLNPFKHRYHPGHNNLDDRYAEPKRESLDVTRQISFQFSAEDPDNTTLAGWGDDQLGGIYREILVGLHKAPIHVQGTFRLRRISDVPVLNDLPL